MKREQLFVDRHRGRLKDRVTLLWGFEPLLWGISSRFPLDNHFDLPASEFIFGLSQEPPMYVYSCFNQDGF